MKYKQFYKWHKWVLKYAVVIIHCYLTKTKFLPFWCYKTWDIYISSIKVGCNGVLLPRQDYFIYTKAGSSGTRLTKDNYQPFKNQVKIILKWWEKLWWFSAIRHWSIIFIKWLIVSKHHLKQFLIICIVLEPGNDKRKSTLVTWPDFLTL